MLWSASTFHITHWFAMAGALLVVGAGCPVLTEKIQPDEDAAMKKETESVMMEEKTEEKNNDEAMMEKKNENVMAEKETNSDMEKDDSAAQGSYEAYSPSKLALAEEGRVVLFFKANWCPTCRAVDADIKSHLSQIPAGTHILEVNYDTSSDLKKQYGVTYQHTFVEVDASGNMIRKWSGGLTLADVVSHL